MIISFESFVFSNFVETWSVEKFAKSQFTLWDFRIVRFRKLFKNLFELKLDLLYFHEKMRSDRTASSANPHPHLNQNFRSLCFFMLGIDYFDGYTNLKNLFIISSIQDLYTVPRSIEKLAKSAKSQFLPCDCLNHVSSRKLKLYCIFTRKCGATASSAIRIPTWIKTSEVQGIQWFAI